MCSEVGGMGVRGRGGKRVLLKGGAGKGTECCSSSEARALTYCSPPTLPSPPSTLCFLQQLQPRVMPIVTPAAAALCERYAVSVEKVLRLSQASYLDLLQVSLIRDQIIH